MSVPADFKNIVKKYGDVTVIDGLNLNIKKGEFFTLLGPSGCGKTTLLRMVAGFHSAESGELLIADKDINKVPAHKRNMGMVFQNYAIFPHMTVFDNVAYGLKARKTPKDSIQKQVLEMLLTMQIEHLKDRMPKNLSGGQQQRVALARAIVIKPSMLLMDEPLSNLDAKLRIDMRIAIKKIQRDVGITTIYVTHDQEEALAISDRIAVIDSGIIQQVGQPLDIYLNSANVFVATFIGHTNILECTLLDKTLLWGNYSFVVDKVISASEKKRVKVGIRPESFILVDNSKEGIKGTVDLVTFLGQFVQYQICLSSGKEIEFKENAFLEKDFLEVGDKITLQPNLKMINVFDENGVSIISK